jgi:hypothetical protein
VCVGGVAPRGKSNYALARIRTGVLGSTGQDDNQTTLPEQDEGKRSPGLDSNQDLCDRASFGGQSPSDGLSDVPYAWM